MIDSFRSFITAAQKTKKCPEGYRFDKSLGVCVPKGVTRYYPFYGFGSRNGTTSTTSNNNGQNGNGSNGNGQSGNNQSGNGGNNNTGNGNGGNGS